MIISLTYFLALALGFMAMAVWRRHWLLGAWITCILICPTAQARVAGAPIYLYDVAAALLIVAWIASGELNRWPLRVPRWHWWFIGAALVLSVGFGFIRFGLSPQIVWIWGHASLAWITFAFGIVILLSNGRETYLRALRWTMLPVSVVLCTMAVFQFMNLPGSENISAWYYGDLGSEGSVEILRLSDMSNRAPGPHFAPTAFGGVALLMGMVYWLVTDERHGGSRLLVSLAALLTVMCTVSRHVMLAMAIGLALFVLTSEIRRLLKVVMVGLPLALVVAGTSLAFITKDGWINRLGRWDAGILKDENVTMRIIDGPTRLVNAIVEEPSVLITGAGLDPEKLSNRHRRSEMHESGFVSNGFLLPLYYLGIGGFILHAAFWWWTWRLSHRFPRGQRSLYASLVLTAIVIVASDNYSFMYEPAMALLFLLSGLMAGRQHQWWTSQTEVLSQPEPAGPIPRPVGGGAYAS